MSLFLRNVVFRRNCSLLPRKKLVNNPRYIRSFHLGKSDKASVYDDHVSYVSYKRVLDRAINAEKKLSILEGKSAPGELNEEVSNQVINAEKKLEISLDELPPLAMFIVGRCVLQQCFTLYIDKVYLKQYSCKKPSLNDLELAWTKFLKDEKNELASKIRTHLSMTPESIMEGIRGIHELLANYDKQTIYTYGSGKKFYIEEILNDIEQYSDLSPPRFSFDQQNIINTIRVALHDVHSSE